MKGYDFGGWATKNDLRCSDGRTIRHNAFKDNDGKRVPLVWQHQHNDPTLVLGYADLKNMDEGVYAYGKFNDSQMGQHTKMLVQHGDITSLSIYANQLKQMGGDVIHGNIREVSIVLSPANPGASIEFTSASHSDDGEADEAVIYTGEGPEIMHDDVDEQPEPSEQKEEDQELKHSDDHGKDEKKMAENSNEKTVKEVFDTLNEEQKQVVYFMIGQALEEKGEEKDEEEPEMVKHNLFDNTQNEPVLTHSDYKVIFDDAKRMGSLRDAVLAHMEQDDEDGALAHAVDAQGSYLLDDQNNKIRYGIANMNYLFPDYRTVQPTPEFIKRDTEWVNVVMSGVHHTPFSRIKSVFANITMDEARARGYIKGNMKKEEIFSLLKRTTDPQTIYKKQKMDRDDVIDIVDLDVVAFIKSEMRVMLDEEIARAILIGDGRLTSDDDHISHDHIRPIWTDAALYTIQVTVPRGDDDSKTAKNIIRSAIKSRKDYKGSGNPVLFTTEDWLNEMLLLEDGIGHTLYQSEAQLATAMRVSKIVTVPVMENQSRDNKALIGIIVNLKDYNVGADKGGAVSMFEDFDIDYNQMKYLIETRCSGALIKPYSAIVLELAAGNPT